MQRHLYQRSLNSFLLHQSYWWLNCVVSKHRNLVDTYLCLGSYVPKQGVGQRHFWAEAETGIVCCERKALECKWARAEGG